MDNAEVVRLMSQCSWYTLHAVAQELGLPTEGNVPEAIWRKSNFEGESFRRDALEFMPRIGYQPFVGYPLQLCRQRTPQEAAIHAAQEAALKEIRENKDWPAT